MDAFFQALALYLVIVAGCLLLAVYVYGEDGVGAAAVLVHVVGSDGSILQPLLSINFMQEKGIYVCLYHRVLTPHSLSSRRREGR
jgi:hypothetical protein